MIEYLVVFDKNLRKKKCASVFEHLTKINEFCTFEYKEQFLDINESNTRFLGIWSDCDINKHVAKVQSQATDEYLLVHKLIRTPSSIAFFEGALLNDFEVNALKNKVQNHISDVWNFLCRQAQKEEVLGNYCLGIYNREGVCSFETSLLATYPAHWAEDDEVFAISNNPALLSSLVGGKKSLDGISWKYYFGMSLDLSSSYENVYRFPQNSGLIVDKHNRPHFKSLCPNFYRKLDSEKREYLYNLAFNQSAELIYNLANDGKVRSAITGGYDSRVTLGFALKTGVTDKLDYYVLGVESSADVKAARYLSKEFSLKLDVQKPSLNINDLEASFEDAKLKYYRSFATIEFNEFWNDNPNSLYKHTLDGVGNEFFRAYFGLHVNQDGIDNKILKKNDISKYPAILGNADRYFQPYIKEQLSKYHKKFKHLYDVDLYWPMARGPQFHGGYNMYLNDPEHVTIGYSPILHRLGFTDCTLNRIGCKVAFDLMKDCDSRLVSIPFAEKTWPEAMLRQNRFRYNLPLTSFEDDVKNLPLHVNFYNDQKVEFLKKNIKLNEEFYNTIGKHYINSLERRIDSDPQNKSWEKFELINLYGLSIFMDNMETKVIKLGYNEFKNLGAESLNDFTCDVAYLQYRPSFDKHEQYSTKELLDKNLMFLTKDKYYLDFDD